MLSKCWQSEQEPEETSSFLICCVYGPPGGCGALSSHVISWCLRPALRPAQMKHVLPLVLTILHRIFTAWLQCELLIYRLIFNEYTSLLGTYSVYILLCRRILYIVILLCVLFKCSDAQIFRERNSDLSNTGVANNTCITVNCVNINCWNWITIDVISSTCACPAMTSQNVCF